MCISKKERNPEKKVEVSKVSACASHYGAGLQPNPQQGCKIKLSINYGLVFEKVGLFE